MAYILAGGRGSRLMELTDRRAKPAVFFGGKSRIIDFALSNALNSGIRRIGVATQYKAHSLIRHLQRGWNFFWPERNESFDILPASQRVAKDLWYAGTADAVYQNIDIIDSYGPRYIVILAGDHVYKMDYEPMLQQHVEQRADVTIGCLEVPRSEASGFGVLGVDETDLILSFLEKPADPPGMPDNPDVSRASMGIYVFETRFLFEQLIRDAADPHSSRDFGRDIIPFLVKHSRAVAHRFTRSCVRSTAEAETYWRDVGTVDAYWKANIDLTDALPALWRAWQATTVCIPVSRYASRKSDYIIPAWGEISTRPHFDDRTRRVLVIGTMVALDKWDEFRIPPHQYSRKLLSILDRLGCFSFRSALASIWRMRSRVTENC